MNYQMKEKIIKHFFKALIANAMVWLFLLIGSLIYIFIAGEMATGMGVRVLTSFISTIGSVVGLGVYKLIFERELL